MKSTISNTVIRSTIWSFLTGLTFGASVYAFRVGNYDAMTVFVMGLVYSAACASVCFTKLHNDAVDIETLLKKATFRYSDKETGQ